MSVAATSNISRTKRSFEEAENSSSPAGSKRVRVLNSPAAGRCTHFAAEATVFQVSQSNLQVLFSLFPEMEEQTIFSVLSDCGDNIDAAIKRLGQLRLSAEGTAGSTPGAEDAGAGPNSREQQQDASSSGPPTPQTPDDWVEVLVQEMAAARDVGDARVRAARVLSMFAVRDQDKAALLGKLQELQKENHILKRAVQIQNSKLQEKAQQDAELQQLRMMLGQYQEQVRTLEMNNYSLALHLQKATNDASLARGHRPPDVF